MTPRGESQQQGITDQRIHHDREETTENYQADLRQRHILKDTGLVRRRSDEFRRRRGAFTEEVLLHLLQHEFLRFFRAQMSIFMCSTHMPQACFETLS